MLRLLPFRRPLMGRRPICRERFLFLSAERFFHAWKRQAGPDEAAEAFGVSARSVRRLFRAFEQHGEQALVPGYAGCGTNQPHRMNEPLAQQALHLRHQHPRWGAPLIRVILSHEHPEHSLPTPRTIQRWLEKQDAAPAPAGRRPRREDPRATKPHEVWQMDAAEQVALRDGRRVSWVRLVDEFTGAVLNTVVFPQGAFNTVDAAKVQDHLRVVFSRWGRPWGFRVDNGFPWGSSGDLPPDLALWLIGLDLHVAWNPARQPQKNGKVERSQGVGKNWVEPETCHSPGELQERFDAMDRIQREEYPHQGDLSRWALFPQLKHSGRVYDLAWERQHWSMSQVLEHLSTYVLSRHVDQAGLVSIYNRNYYVGKHHQKKTVYVFLDPLRVEWVITTIDGQQLRSHPAQELTQPRIIELNVTHRRKRPQAKPAKQRRQPRVRRAAAPPQCGLGQTRCRYSRTNSVSLFPDKLDVA
jgi:transposase